MRNILIIISVFLIPRIGMGQYLIEGKVDSSSTFHVAHLDINNTWDYFCSLYDTNVIKSIPIESDGTFSFIGSELPEEDGFYRIRYSKTKDDFYIRSIDKNYINFIFSNKDTIKITNTSFTSDKPENKTLLKYIGQHDTFLQQQSKSNNKLSTEMLKTKHKEYCKKEILQNKHGLTNLYLLHSSNMSIDENPSIFKKVGNELKNASFRPQYHTSLDKLIQVYDYKSLEQKSTWLRNILIGSLALNVLFLIFYLQKRKSTATSSHTLKPKLTNKEMEVLDMIKDKKSNKEIASELFVSEATIKTHINNIYRKLNVKSRQEAINSVKN